MQLSSQPSFAFERDAIAYRTSIEADLVIVVKELNDLRGTSSTGQHTNFVAEILG